MEEMFEMQTVRDPFIFRLWDTMRKTTFGLYSFWDALQNEVRLNKVENYIFMYSLEYSKISIITV